MTDESDMAQFVGELRASMQEDFDGAELEGFNIAMKLIHKWARFDGADFDGLAEQLEEAAEGIPHKGMGDGFNAATSAFQGALFALEYAGVIE